MGVNFGFQMQGVGFRICFGLGSKLRDYDSGCRV